MVKKSRKTNKLDPHFGSTKMKAGLEHRAKKWEPVFGIKRCDNKYPKHRAKKWEPVFVTNHATTNT